ncbi:MAG TPA: DUF4389 domain-containing protein [Actinomycetota bacterium]
MQAQATSYPVTVDIDAPLEVARWRPLVHWLLAVPHLFISSALQMLRGVLQFLSFFAIVFTKKIPRSFFELIVMTMRYQWRVTSYFTFMRESYPPFEFDPAAEDPGTDAAKFSVEYPEELNRFMPFVKVFLAVPHFVVFAVYAVGGMFAWLAAFFAVLFTGRFPPGLRNYMVGVSRYGNRIFAYVGLLRDEYPPFSLR